MKGEKKRLLPLSWAKRFGYRSHVRFEHLCRNKGFQEWLDRDLVGTYINQKWGDDIYNNFARPVLNWIGEKTGWWETNKEELK